MAASDTSTIEVSAPRSRPLGLSVEHTAFSLAGARPFDVVRPSGRCCPGSRAPVARGCVSPRTGITRALRRRGRQKLSPRRQWAHCLPVQRSARPSEPVITFTGSDVGRLRTPMASHRGARGGRRARRTARRRRRFSTADPSGQPAAESRISRHGREQSAGPAPACLGIGATTPRSLRVPRSASVWGSGLRRRHFSACRSKTRN